MPKPFCAGVHFCNNTNINRMNGENGITPIEGLVEVNSSMFYCGHATLCFGRDCQSLHKDCCRKESAPHICWQNEIDNDNIQHFINIIDTISHCVN